MIKALICVFVFVLAREQILIRESLGSPSDTVQKHSHCGPICRFWSEDVSDIIHRDFGSSDRQVGASLSGSNFSSFIRSVLCRFGGFSSFAQSSIKKKHPDRRYNEHPERQKRHPFLRFEVALVFLGCFIASIFAGGYFATPRNGWKRHLEVPGSVFVAILGALSFYFFIAIVTSL